MEMGSRFWLTHKFKGKIQPTWESSRAPNCFRAPSTWFKIATYQCPGMVSNDFTPSGAATVILLEAKNSDL
jgi:hypothetical protein